MNGCAGKLPAGVADIVFVKHNTSTQGCDRHGGIIIKTNKKKQLERKKTSSSPVCQNDTLRKRNVTSANSDLFTVQRFLHFLLLVCVVLLCEALCAACLHERRFVNKVVFRVQSNKYHYHKLTHTDKARTSLPALFFRRGHSLKLFISRLNVSVASIILDRSEH